MRTHVRYAGAVAAGSALVAVQVASPPRTADVAALRKAEARSTPDALAATRTLPLPEALAALVPGGVLQRGTVVGVAGPGATTLAMALGAAVSASGAWLAVAGVPTLGLAAVAELGVHLERLLVVADPPVESWATVVAALVDAVELVVVRPPARLAGADARRLHARARERGAVVCAVGDTWPQPADVRLTVTAPAWTGPTGGGSGRLEARRVEVVAGGRGAAARERRVPLWLPDRDGRVAVVADHRAVEPVRPDLAAAG